MISPIRLFVILQKFAPDVFAGVEAGDDRVNDPRRAVHQFGFAPLNSCGNGSIDFT